MTVSGPAAALSRIAAIRSGAEALRPSTRQTGGASGAFGSVLAAATVEAGADAPSSTTSSSSTPVAMTPTSVPVNSTTVVNGAGYADLFAAAGERHGIDPNLLAAVAQIESAFNPTAISPAGAQGLMQFMPATAAEMGVDPFDPASAIDGAARYLRQQLDRFGTTELALAAYNAGPGAVSKHDGIPPYPETQNYVTKVLAAWEQRT